MNVPFVDTGLKISSKYLMATCFAPFAEAVPEPGGFIPFSLKII